MLGKNSSGVEFFEFEESTGWIGEELSFTIKVYSFTVSSKNDCESLLKL